MNEHTGIAALRAQLQTLIADDQDCGIQVAAFVGGEPVFTVAEGRIEPGGDNLRDDTLFTVFSVSKALTTMAALAAAGDSGFGLDRPIAEIWPAMAAPSKNRITLRDCLTHRAGLPFMPAGTTVDEMCDWGHMCEAIAAQELAWEPGTASGYHAYTFGWLAGEVARRVTGTDRSFGAYFRERIAARAGVDDIWFGLPASESGRVATIVRDYPLLPAGLPVERAMPNALTPSEAVYSRPAVRAAVLPGAGGIASARGLAKLFSLLVPVETQSLLDPGLLTRALQVDFDGPDCISTKPSVRGLGFYIGGGHDNAGQVAPFEPSARSFGHSGAGGHLAWADVRRGAGFAILRNRMFPDGFAAAQVTKSVNWTLEAFDRIVGERRPA